MGRFIKIMPIAVVLALAFSLLECILILPPHLGHSLKHRKDTSSQPGRIKHLSQLIRSRLDAAVRWFIDVPFIGIYRLATKYRYVTLALAVAVMVAVAGAGKSGFIPFIGFPKTDSDTLLTTITLPTGTPFERTDEVARYVSHAALKVNDHFVGEDGQDVVQRVYSLLGQTAESMGPGDSGAHICQIIVELSPTELRGNKITSEQIKQQWRENTGDIPDAVSVEYGGFHGGPGGKAIELKLLGPDTDFLKPIAEKLKARLEQFDGVTDIRDDALPGKMEMKIYPKPGAENLGIQLKTIASQLRDAFYGNESLKIQRGRDEIKVMVRYPESERQSLSDVENMRVRTASGAEVPFAEVADVQLRRGYTTLRRLGRSSVINISADVDEQKANSEKILNELSKPKGFFSELTTDYPGLRIEQWGQRQQLSESLGTLFIWFPIALLGIYTLLAALFKSYVQPIIIMVAIPFGLVGAVIGHWILGYAVTMLSMFGMVALAGIVVNDSLILIDQVNRSIRRGQEVFASVEHGARTRFRPIILTTLTTVAGMAPLLLERSFQAQFLKPMAVSIAFGLMFATMLTLLVVPSLYLIGNDLRRVFRWLHSGQWLGPEAMVKRPEPLGDE